MSGVFPKPPEVQAFENWASSKPWFQKVRGNFSRNSNDTHYNHFKVNDRAMAFAAGVAYAKSQVAKDAADYGKALNSAGWVFLDSCPEKSTTLFNSVKPALRTAIMHYIEKVLS